MLKQGQIILALFEKYNNINSILNNINNSKKINNNDSA